MDTNMNCAVCGAALEGDICPRCGWVMLRFPAEVPPAIADFNRRREEVCGWIFSKLDQARSLIDEAQAKADEAQSKADQLSQQLSEVQAKLDAELAAPKSLPVKGVVMVEDTQNHVRTYLPVLEGVNTYGSAPSDGNHHQILLAVRGVRFSEKHFAVSTSPKGMTIQSVGGAPLSLNGIPVTKPEYARQTSKFYINDRILINISNL